MDPAPLAIETIRPFIHTGNDPQHVVIVTYDGTQWTGFIRDVSLNAQQRICVKFFGELLEENPQISDYRSFNINNDRYGSISDITYAAANPSAQATPAIQTAASVAATATSTSTFTTSSTSVQPAADAKPKKTPRGPKFRTPSQEQIARYICTDDADRSKMVVLKLVDDMEFHGWIRSVTDSPDDNSAYVVKMFAIGPKPKEGDKPQEVKMTIFRAGPPLVLWPFADVK